MFPATTVAGGLLMAAPDVCKTPMPPVGQPVPIPYPNTAQPMLASPFAANVLVSAMPAVHQQSVIPMSNGNEAGVAGGMASAVIVGPARFTTASVKVHVGSMPVVRLTDTTAQNGMSQNAVGTVVTPSQTKVLIGS